MRQRDYPRLCPERTGRMLRRAVEQLVDSAIAGTPITQKDAVKLMALPADSAEASYIAWAAWSLGKEASDNTGQIYAQIGLDATPCPEDCAFCDLGATNALGRGRAEVPDDDIVFYARTFDEANVHLISLMATAAYGFDHFCNVVSKVRDAVADDMPLMANIGDVTPEQAATLKELGIQAFYHANRLGEGEITRIRPEARLRTMEAVTNAGLKLMSAVEPVHAQSNPIDIAAHMREVIGLRPYCAGVGALTVVPGTKMASYQPISRRRARYLAAIMRLIAGRSIPFGCGCGNVVWADAGTNPRGRNLSTDPDFLKRDVRRLRKELTRDEWSVPARPLSSWM